MNLSAFPSIGEEHRVSLILAIVLCFLIPMLVIARLLPSLVEHAPMKRNYRGADVLAGLGIVWFIWLVAIWVGSALLGLLDCDQPGWMSPVLAAFPLLAGTCALGMFDDWMGDSSSRGFKGHFRQLSRCVLTTGMVKLLGIGALSLATAAAMADVSEPWWVLRLIFATFAMALFANLMNLFDLRPLRASKVYIICIALCAAALVLSHRIDLSWMDILCLAIACLGPVLAIGYFDAREVAMLGDAGANTMGALVGYLFSLALPIWLLIPMTAILLAVNLLSERVSFTQAIEKNLVLRRLDRLFRPKEILRQLDSEVGSKAHHPDSGSEGGGDR